LVLGAGGRVGMASHAGVLCALHEVAGIDPNDAELVIGTSAGSVIGALVRLGWSPRQIWNIATRTGPIDPDEDIGRSDLFHRAWQNPTQLVRRSLGSAYVITRSVVRVPLIPMPLLARRVFPGGFLAMKDEEADVARGIADEWPREPLWLCTVNVETGKRVVLGRRDDRPPLTQAVLASSAIPGYYQPIRFDGRTLVDGGMHSTTNLDLAVEASPQLVIAAAPMGYDPHRSPGAAARAIRRPVNRGLARGRLTLGAAGRSLLLVRPGREEVAAQGVNVMRDTDLEPVATAAYDAAARLFAGVDTRPLLEPARLPALAG
jgi:NTE family protein